MYKMVQKITAIIALAAGVFSYSALGAVYYYQQTLPDQFYVQTADETSFAGTGQFTFSSGTDDKVQQASTNTGSFFTNINLFGIIPIKDVHVSVQDKPMVSVSGEPFGVKMFTDGVVVVGISPVQTNDGNKNPGDSAGLKVGDVITRLDGNNVKTNDEIIQLAQQGKQMQCEYVRANITYTTSLTPVMAKDGNYKLGIWVRDSSAGIGTMTFVDNEQGVFAGLGHGISDVDTKEIMPLYTGEIVAAIIGSVKMGVSGTPGELRGSFASSTSIGELRKNDETGVYGVFYGTQGSESMPVAYKQEVKEGTAQILTTIDGSTPRLFTIEIEKINLNDNEKTKNMVIHITDPDLLAITGGIVQGMSGSPIIQNGQLVGAVTHVLVNDPTRGYGIFAENMYNSTKTVTKN